MKRLAWTLVLHFLPNEADMMTLVASLLTLSQIPSKWYPPLCSISSIAMSQHPQSKVFNFTDGLHQRCISAIIPDKLQAPAPILCAHPTLS